MSDPTQHCPGCKKEVRYNPRYTGYFCNECTNLTCDTAGRLIRYTNVDPRNAVLGMSVAATYDDNGEAYRSEDCLVRGIASRAKEARFGGVVVQPIAVWERNNPS